MNKSFSLIELLIVITIIGIFSSLSLAYYNTFTETKKLEQETEKLVDVLELAKKKASSADLAGGCAGIYKGHKVKISGSNYSLNITCDTDNVINRFDLPSSNISLTTTANDILFNKLSNGITPSADVTITLKSLSLKKCRNITITASGLISENTPYDCP